MIGTDRRCSMYRWLFRSSLAVRSCWCRSKIYSQSEPTVQEIDDQGYHNSEFLLIVCAHVVCETLAV